MVGKNPKNNFSLNSRRNTVISRTISRLLVFVYAWIDSFSPTRGRSSVTPPARFSAIHLCCCLHACFPLTRDTLSISQQSLTMTTRPGWKSHRDCCLFVVMSQHESNYAPCFNSIIADVQNVIAYDLIWLALWAIRRRREHYLIKTC